jgi:DNA helicase-2/ATP-dependent DNA helicase PcrA
MFIKELVTKMECGKKHYLQNVLKLQQKTDEYFIFLNEVQDIVKKAVINQSYAKAYEDIEQKFTELKDEWFVSEKAKEQDIKYYKGIFYRYLKYEESQGREIVAADVSYSCEVIIGEEEYTIIGKVDFIVKDKKGYEAIRLKRSKPMLSSRARKAENKPESNIELAMIYHGLNEKYKGLKVSYYHLQNKDDKRTELIAEFNYKANTNIVTAKFSKDILQTILNKIQELNFLSYEKNLEKCTECPYAKACKGSISKNAEENEPVEIKYKPPRFNKKQKQAIEHDKGSLRIVAGAGTGKTTTLVGLFIRLVEKGLVPKSILFLTFTNEAAKELQDRIKLAARHKKIDISGLKVSTYNSFGYEILQDHADLLGHLKVKLINTMDLFDLFSEMINQFNIPCINYSNLYNPMYGIFPKFEKLFLSYLQENSFDEELKANSKLKFDDVQFKALFEGFEWVKEQMDHRGLITYDQQISLVNGLFEAYPHILELYQEKYKFILLDEYQDTAPQQAELVCKIGQNHGNIVVVGDDDQSLYNWRQADNKNILKFHEYFSCTDIILDQNYRSTPSIINSANEVIANNEERFGKKLVARKLKNVEDIDPRICMKDLTYLPELVNDLSKKYALKDITIISRTNKELLQAYELLDTAHIPALSPKKLLIEDEVFNLIVDTLTFMTDEQIDDVTLYNLLSIYGLDDDVLLDRHNCELHTYLTCTGDETYLEYLEKVEALYGISDVKTLLEKILELYKLNVASHKPVIEAMNNLIKDYSIESFNHLLAICKNLIKYSDDTRIEQVNNNAVYLLTGHGAKGKEFPCVIIIGNKFTISDEDEDLEEQRRIFFVALTRAKNELIILDNDRSKKKNVHSLIDELPTNKPEYEQLFIDGLFPNIA